MSIRTAFVTCINMLDGYRKGSHTITSFKVHIVWCTKYRYKVLKGEIKNRCREIIRQICNAFDIVIIKGVVSDDHVHVFVEYPGKLSISDMVKRLKGRSSRMLMDEFPELKKQYWGGHFWSVGYFGATSGNITDKMVEEYLEHHRTGFQDIKDNNTFILEGE